MLYGGEEEPPFAIPVSINQDVAHEHFPNAKDAADIHMQQSNSTVFSNLSFPMHAPIGGQSQPPLGGLPLSLEPTRGSCDGYGLIHHPLANSEVLVDPDVDIFVLSEGIFLETGC